MYNLVFQVRYNKFLFIRNIYVLLKLFRNAFLSTVPMQCCVSQVGETGLSAPMSLKEQSAPRKRQRQDEAGSEGQSTKTPENSLLLRLDYFLLT